jgi:putative PIN family toxin of toxin-antitoxin system
LRVVLDTNVLLSALITPAGPADRIYRAWRGGAFDLASSEVQLDELRRVSRRPELRTLLRPAEAGRLVNLVRHLAILVDPLPDVAASTDPDDDFLLATAVGGAAQYLVSGDKSGLLALKRIGGTRIVSVRQFLREIR